jgi:hypothetical protein
MPTQGKQMQFEQRIKSTIEGMFLLAHQIDAELPARYAQLDALKNQRDISATEMGRNRPTPLGD